MRAARTADGPTIAIVGVTGAVGQEFLTVGCRACPVHIEFPNRLPDLLLKLYLHLQVLKERNFPYSDIKMLASARWGQQP